jgi:hypothetical protein
LDVVWWQKVVPVGTMFGGYFDLYSFYFAGGWYYFGMML